jgi:hypothetical protein
MQVAIPEAGPQAEGVGNTLAADEVDDKDAKEAVKMLTPVTPVTTAIATAVASTHTTARRSKTVARASPGLMFFLRNPEPPSFLKLE